MRTVPVHCIVSIKAQTCTFTQQQKAASFLQNCARLYNSKKVHVVKNMVQAIWKRLVGCEMADGTTVT
jgi:hypothetical protein